MPRAKDIPEDYEERRVALRRKFNVLKTGAQQAACYDLRIPPSQVSGTLRNATPERPIVLRKLEEWYEEFKDEYAPD